MGAVTATPLEWKPLLDGVLAATATAAIDDIAAALAALPPNPDVSRARWAHNLSSGTAGWALFHAYRANAGPAAASDERDDERAMQLISLALDAAPSAGMDASLYHGITGLAWTVEHLGKHFYDLGDIDPLARVDAHLLAQVDRMRRDQPIELMRGIIGLGVYALERLPRPSAMSLVSAVVKAVEDGVTSTEHGFTWSTAPEHLGPDIAFAPNGYINVGVAHGVTGIVSFLARCIAADVEVARARRLLEGAVEWLLTQRESAPGDRHLFPAFVMPDRVVPPGHWGWCHGELGIACVLEVAGRITETTAWLAAARETALATAAQPIGALGFDDAGLCHGACGAGHLLHRLYRATAEPALAAAARRCFEHGLAMRRPAIGVAGFQEFEPPDRWLDTPGLLAGAAGIGLALVSAVTDQVPGWDAVFLISGP